MTRLDVTLDQLGSDAGWSPDWENVLVRAGTVTVSRARFGRRVVVALVVLAAALIPIAALAATQGWWFLRFGAPQPTHAPVVVKTGAWSGRAWRLIAYPSSTDGLCFTITTATSSVTNPVGAMGCAPVVGVARTASTKGSPDMPITYLSSSARPELPPYIAGPVIETAAIVAIRLADGRTLTTPTFAAPAPLDHVRFYATRFPSNVADQVPVWLAGLDSAGTVVACLVPATAHEGISPLDACR